MTKRRLAVSLVLTAILAATATHLLNGASSRSVAEDLTGLDLRKSILLLERREWPVLGNVGYSLFVFQLDPASASYPSVCRSPGYHERLSFSGHAALPGLRGEFSPSPDNCYRLIRENGITTTVVFTDDQKLFVSISQ
jgi:hypothetical protein